MGNLTPSHPCVAVYPYKKELKSILEAKICFKVSVCIWHFDIYKFEFEKNWRKEKILFSKNQQLFEIFWKYIE